MAFQSFGPLSNAPELGRRTVNDVAWQIFRDDAVPAITHVATKILRREERAIKAENATTAEAATKMLGIWEEVFELLHKRVGEKFPGILQGDPPSVRDAWRW